MLKRYFCAVPSFFAVLLVTFAVAAAGDAPFLCQRLDAKATGDMAKYSLHGEANGPVFFSGIGCAIKHRNKEFCAMEMISFDTTAKVYDYYTGEEIDIGKAYFCLDEKNSEAPIAAFKSKEAAARYEAASGGGIVLDYTALTERKF